MAREIIILGVDKRPDNSIHLSGVFWLAAPASQVVPKPGFTSQVPLASAASWGTTAGEVTALQNGTVVEQGWDSGQLPGTLTVNQIEAGLQNAYAAAQTALNATATASKFIGASWDGTTWTTAP